jgi:hypothetical protein
MPYQEVRHVFGTVPHGPPPPGVIWTICDDDFVVAVTFLCPCNCGTEVYTPVTDATKGQAKIANHWLYSRGDTGVTLSPSIRFTGRCKAHFNIVNGEAVMHGDSGR